MQRYEAGEPELSREEEGGAHAGAAPPALPYRVIFFDLGETLVTRNRAWMPGAPEVLDRLRKAGVQLGIISNTGTLDRRELLKERLPSGFDFALFRAELVFLSSEAGVNKPSPAIFRKALQKARQLDATATCLYCSENLLETLAAQRAGLDALRLQPTQPGMVGELSELPATLARLAGLPG